MLKIIPPSGLEQITEDGIPTQEHLAFLGLLARLQPLRGTGSPEGVVDAAEDAIYIDDAGTAGSIMYVKRDAAIGGDSTQGWILV